MKERRSGGKLDGPNSSINNVKHRTFSYSFGVSRDAMKKIHVDEILKGKKEPN